MIKYAMNKLDDVNKVIIKKLSILSMKLAMLDIKAYYEGAARVARSSYLFFSKIQGTARR